MRRTFIATAAALSLLAQPASAELTSCPMVRGAAGYLGDRIEDLSRTHPGTLAFFMGGGAFLEAANPRDAAEAAAMIAGLAITCAIVIDTRSCAYVGERLTAIAMGVGITCEADRRYRCGVC